MMQILLTAMVATWGVIIGFLIALIVITFVGSLLDNSLD